MPLPNPVTTFRDLAVRFRDVLFRRDDVLLKELISRTGDEELAHLIDESEERDKLHTFRMLTPERRAAVIDWLSEYSQEQVLRAITKDELQAMLTAAESNEAVDIIQMLDDAARTRIVAELRKADPKGLLPLLDFNEETAGGLMKSELLRFKANATVEDVRRSLAGAAHKRLSHMLYVTDDNEQLLGVIAPLKLLQAQTTQQLRELMQPATSLPWNLDQEQVAQVFDEVNALELPVHGPKGKLIGIISADDIFEVMEKEYAEDISRLTGVDENDHVSDPVLHTVRRRLPWLIVNLATAILAASIVGHFQDTIQRVVLLAAFMPIIAGMGGNAATQTLGVAIRGIALGELHHLNTYRAILKEVATGAVNGFASGLLMGGIAFAWTKDLTLGLVILVAMTVNLLIAGIGGVAIPVIMKALRIDPALASTVFVTTMTDCCGFFVFLGLATMYL